LRQKKATKIIYENLELAFERSEKLNVLVEPFFLLREKFWISKANEN